MNLSGFDRLYLVPDDYGVGIECHDHWDGGRPLAWYSRDHGPSPDPHVVHVDTITDLLAFGRAHLDGKHTPLRNLRPMSDSEREVDMTEPNDERETQTLRNQMKAAQVKCCEAGRAAYPQPCPWHGEDGWPTAWRPS